MDERLSVYPNQPLLLLEVFCPSCRSALTQGEQVVLQGHTVPAGQDGEIRLSALFGRNEAQTELAIGDGDVVTFACPSCERSLTVEAPCKLCGAPSRVGEPGEWRVDGGVRAAGVPRARPRRLRRRGRDDRPPEPDVQDSARLTTGWKPVLLIGFGALMQTHRRYNFKNQHFVGEEGRLIPLLQQAQAEDGYLRRERMEEIHEISGIPLAHIYGVATFYAQFRLKPVGKYLLRVCHGTACHVSGAVELSQAVEKHLGVPERRDDGRPDVQYRDGVVPRLLLAGAGDDDQRRDVRQPQPVGRGEGREEVPEGGAVMTRVTVGYSTCGIAAGAEDTYKALEAKLAGLADGAGLSRTGCVGMCYQEPLVEISNGDGVRYLYGHISPDKVGAADRRAHRPGDAGGRLAGLDERRPGHRHRLPVAPAPDCPAQLRQHRSRVDRRVHRDGRLPGPPEGARGEGPRRSRSTR